MVLNWYPSDSRLIPWAYQGAVLAEYARSRNLVLDEWTAQAKVSPGDAMSVRQVLALLVPLQRSAKDSAFVLGQMSLPGHYGLASQALQQAQTLTEALQLLARYAARLWCIRCATCICGGHADERGDRHGAVAGGRTPALALQFQPHQACRYFAACQLPEWQFGL